MYKRTNTKQAFILNRLQFGNKFYVLHRVDAADGEISLYTTLTNINETTGIKMLGKFKLTENDTSHAKASL